MHHTFIDGLEMEGFKLPSLFEIFGYKIFFWSNENDGPIHVHIAKGKPIANSTKVWLTKSGGCILANNNSKISNKDLRELLDIITSNYFVIISEWKKHNVDKDIKFYC